MALELHLPQFVGCIAFEALERALSRRATKSSNTLKSFTTTAGVIPLSTTCAPMNSNDVSRRQWLLNPSVHLFGATSHKQILRGEGVRADPSFSTEGEVKRGYPKNTREGVRRGHPTTREGELELLVKTREQGARRLFRSPSPPCHRWPSTPPSHARALKPEASLILTSKWVK
jgi:hypothetical protein